MVWRLDRLGRSLKELIEVVGHLEGQGVEFESLKESLEITTPGGKLVFNVFASLAELGERIRQWEWLNGNNQRFAIEEVG